MAQTKNDDFLKSIMATFKAEAEEHIQSISEGLTELPQMPLSAARSELVERIYRDTHSLKGAARAVGLTAIEVICQAVEDVFAAVKKMELPASNSLSAAVLPALEEVRRLVEGQKTVAANTAQIVATLKAAVYPQRAPVTRVLEPEMPVSGKPPAQAGSARSADAGETGESDATSHGFLTDTVRVPVVRLEALLRLSEELLRIELMSAQRSAETVTLLEMHGAWTKRWNELVSDSESARRGIRTGGAAVEPESAPGAEESLVDASRELSDFHCALKEFSVRLDVDRRWTSTMLDQLMSNAKEVLMLHFSMMGMMLTRMVAELSRTEGKQAALAVNGTHIHIDKRILDEMNDPLIHLVRNCVGHGIEPVEVRRRLGKPECGTITVSLTQQDGNRVEICVEDDGAGIDCAKVKASAIKSGQLDVAEAGTLADGDILPLIFRSGVSTSPLITYVSGRGLGMAIVSEKVEKLGGRVLVESTPGKGTRIRLLLPATLATFRGTLVRADDRSFVLPTTSVEKAIRFPADQIHSVENRATITFAGRPISFVRLVDVLGIPVRQAAENKSHVTALVVNSAGRHIGLGISEILGEQEVLVRSLGPQLARVRNISGAAMLGSGALVPILNVSDLMRSVRVSDGAPHAADHAPDASSGVKSLLVVEDSITSRVLLKSILQAAGYEVTTAVDGVDALTTMRIMSFDLVVSDVEMPRMNGFELTARIRQDATLKDIPVVLVTARESREDKERGIECGANAYIAKSSFDQTNLLSAIEGLL